MVDKAHIDLLVATAVRGPRPERGIMPDASWTLRWWSKPASEIRSASLDELQAHRREATPERAHEVGWMLLLENVRSVRHRYDTPEDGDDLPGSTSAYWREPYRWEDPRYRPTAAEALKAVACYEYQSCEHPEWESSEAAQFCEALRHALINALPGYEAAPWEWRPEEVSARRVDSMAPRRGLPAGIVGAASGGGEGG